ncbi:MAG: hypothetical protein ABSC89_01035 [Verrucomicrobiota bacterium]
MNTTTRADKSEKFRRVYGGAHPGTTPKTQGRPDYGTPDSSGCRANRVWCCRMNPMFRW